MSIQFPPHRVVASASTVLSAVSTTCSRRKFLPISQNRSAWSLPSFFKKDRGGPIDSAGQNLDDPDVRRRIMESKQSAAPSLKNSIFEEELTDASEGQKLDAGKSRRIAPIDAGKFVTDPDPRSRIRWERKKVIQMVRRQTAAAEISEYDRKIERIAQTERQLQHKSPRLPTSVKKLMLLARQIQGKTLEDALLQMQYSKKKMATEVKFQLEVARDKAVVSRGMGLGQSPDSSTKAAPITIQTKDGETLKVFNPTNMYVAEAWVNRMKPRLRRPEFKARGRVGILESPSTTISVVLKEERTRIREHNDRVAKEAKRKPWVHLPNRPVTAQRPYYSW